MAVSWVGSDYDVDRLLLLGESAYSWLEGEEVVHPTPRHAQVLVELALAGERGPFMNKLTRGIAGIHQPTTEQVAAAWNRVAFMNYIEGTVGFGPRVRPSDDQWHDAAKAFPDLMEKLRPRNVIVLGQTCGPGCRTTSYKSPMMFQGWRLADGKVVMCWAVRHPSAGLSWGWLAQLVAYIREGKVVKFGAMAT